jgi:hypothetical protein
VALVVKLAAWLFRSLLATPWLSPITLVPLLLVAAVVAQAPKVAAVLAKRLPVRLVLLVALTALPRVLALALAPTAVVRTTTHSTLMADVV